jgi:hypothetical protein
VALCAGVQFGWQHLPEAHAISPPAITMVAQVSQGAMSGPDFEELLRLQLKIDDMLKDILKVVQARDAIKLLSANSVDALTNMPANTQAVRDDVAALFATNGSHSGVASLNEKTEDTVALFQSLEPFFNTVNPVINPTP